MKKNTLYDDDDEDDDEDHYADHIKRPTAKLILLEAKKLQDSCQNRPHNTALSSLPGYDNHEHDHDEDHNDRGQTG